MNSTFPLDGHEKVTAGEWAGPCPWCGGKDRFRTWPESDRYWCRKCDRKGDSIQFARDFHGMTFSEACSAAGRPLPERRLEKAHSARKASWVPKSTPFPCRIWQASAHRFLSSCRPGGDYAESRGITSTKVSWNPSNKWEARESWGLPPEFNSATGKPKKVWLPEGLVIPTSTEGRLVNLKIRRKNWSPKNSFPKYAHVPGGSTSPMVLGQFGLPVTVVESELDALLVDQEAGDLCSAIALRSATNKPDAAAWKMLKAAPSILVALDYDEAGAKAVPWWQDHFPSAKRWPPVTGKDIGDIALEPGLIRTWIEVGLKNSSFQKHGNTSTSNKRNGEDAHLKQSTAIPPSAFASFKHEKRPFWFGTVAYWTTGLRLQYNKLKWQPAAWVSESQLKGLREYMSRHEPEIRQQLNRLDSRFQPDFMADLEE